MNGCGTERYSSGDNRKKKGGRETESREEKEGTLLPSEKVETDGPALQHKKRQRL